MSVADHSDQVDAWYNSACGAIESWNGIPGGAPEGLQDRVDRAHFMALALLDQTSPRPSSRTSISEDRDTRDCIAFYPTLRTDCARLACHDKV